MSAVLAWTVAAYGGPTTYATNRLYQGASDATIVIDNVGGLARTPRVVALAFDRNFGLVRFAPLWALVLAAGVVLALRKRAAWPLAVLVGVQWGTAGWLALTMRGWWFPGRQVVTVLPLFVPGNFAVDGLLRALIGVAIFTGAYMAEVIRGGLAAVARGQAEAASALGLSWWKTTSLIVLPQALALVVPAVMNNFIAIFKDTSLVTIVSLYELTGSLGLALNADADWRPYKLEGYFFIAAIYFAFCFAMSRYSLWIEKRLSVSKNR